MDNLILYLQDINIWSEFQLNECNAMFLENITVKNDIMVGEPLDGL